MNLGNPGKVLEELGGTLGMVWGDPAGRPWGILEEPWVKLDASLGEPWEALGRRRGVLGWLGGTLGTPWGVLGEGPGGPWRSSGWPWTSLGEIWGDGELREHQKRVAKNIIGAAPSRQADWQRLRNNAPRLASPNAT